jgi:hypothetical protein
MKGEAKGRALHVPHSLTLDRLAAVSPAKRAREKRDKSESECTI